VGRLRDVKRKPRAVAVYELLIDVGITSYRHHAAAGADAYVVKICSPYADESFL
jgi:hypothetical protein